MPVNYIACNDSYNQTLGYAKVGNNKYSFFYAPVGEYRLLIDDKFDDSYIAWTTDGYPFVFVREDKTWCLWKYYLKEYASSIPADAYVFLDCIFQKVKDDSDVSIKELYKRCRDGIPEQFWPTFDEWILEDSSIQ